MLGQRHFAVCPALPVLLLGTRTLALTEQLWSLDLVTPPFQWPTAPLGGRSYETMEPGLKNSMPSHALTPPENFGKLSLSDCQVFCVEWRVDQGHCSCREGLENSSCLNAELLDVQRTLCLLLSISLACSCHLGS